MRIVWGINILLVHIACDGHTSQRCDYTHVHTPHALSTLFSDEHLDCVLVSAPSLSCVYIYMMDEHTCRCHDPELFPEPDVIATEMPIRDTAGMLQCRQLASS